MESAFGSDFSDVRIHTDIRADQLNRDVNAVAFTTGKDIFFRNGLYDPGSFTGRQLLAHELTHVVQQRGTPVVCESPMQIARRVTNEPAQMRSDREGPSDAGAVGAERAWAADHPQGAVSETDADHLTLWNFDVDGSNLKPEHTAALNRMADRMRVMILAAGVELEIEGHASRSGSEAENTRLSIARANEVFNYLLDRGVPGERVRLDYSGSSRPLFPNITGGSRAHNRRVDLRIVGRPISESKPRPIPEPPAHRRIPEGPELKLGERLPSGSIEFKKEFDPNYPILMGPYILCYPSGQISGKYRMKSMREGSAVLGFSEKGANVQFKQKLNELVEFKVDSSGNAGFGFSGEIFKSELLWDWVKALKGRPIVYSVSKQFASTEYEWPPDLGVKWEIDFEIKVKFSFGPSPAGVAMLARLGLGLGGEAGAAAGTAGAAAGTEGVATGVAALGAPEVLILGGAVIAIATIPLTIHEVMGAHKQGEQNARLFARHNGFALRIAGEATGPDGYSEAFKRLDAARGHEYYEDSYDGWMDADALLARTDKRTREMLSQLGARYGPLGIDPLVMQLLRRSGAFDFKPIPASLGDLAR